MYSFRIAHLVLDEKFIDIAIHNFELLSHVSNDFLCYCTAEPKHIKQKLKIKLFNQQEEIIRYISTQRYNAVVLHSAFMSYKLLNQLEDSLKIIWLTWGYDIFEATFLPSIFETPIKTVLYKPITRSYLNRFGQLRQYIKIEWERWRSGETRNRLKFYNRVDYISTVTNYEFDLLKQNKRFKKAKHFTFQYIDADFLASAQRMAINGNNILIGNSASETNNHMDVLQHLCNVGLSPKQKIILPLSYGASKDYVTKVKTFISQLNWHQPVLSLDTFMPLSEYTHIIQTCRYAIMGAIRQQAMGNIYMLLYQGCKIFFYKDSIAYQELKNNGFYVFAIEDITSSSLSHPLNEMQTRHNLELIQNKLHYKQFISNLQTEIDFIISQSIPSNHI